MRVLVRIVHYRTVAYNSPDIPGAIRARLAYLRRRKALVEEVIQWLEQFAELEHPERSSLSTMPGGVKLEAKWAGAA